MAAKVIQLISILPRRPIEFFDRLRAGVESRFSFSGVSGLYLPCTYTQALPALEASLGVTLRSAQYDSELAELPRVIANHGKNGESWLKRGSVSDFHNADTVLAELCYVLARALRPKIVVETGVCHGITSAHFLAALGRNQHGELHSIDLPPLAAESAGDIGAAIPIALRDRWHLHCGVSHRVLGPLLPQLPEIDIFLHDSLHTRRNLLMEFRRVWPRLRPGGVLIADDVEGNSAFAEWAERSDIQSVLAVQQANKEALLGAIVKARGVGAYASSRRA